MGQVYARVTAEAVNSGIMMLNGSDGHIEEGGSYWINWTNTGGFTGTGWALAWESEYVPLKAQWTANPVSPEYEGYEGFFRYVSNPEVTELDTWLGSHWTDDMKWDFMQKNIKVFTDCSDSVA